MMKKNKQWRLLASFFCMCVIPVSYATENKNPPTQAVTTPVVLSQQHAPAGLTPYTAKYQVLRSGKVHGEAERYLKPFGRGFELGYRSKISWLIFKDERHELSRFNLENGALQPFFYQLRRWGTGPGRHYELNLDWAKHILTVGKEKSVKPLQFDAPWLDSLSYHSQLVLNIAAGKKESTFDVLTRHGDPRKYSYKVMAEETISVPAGQLKTIRVERVGDNLDKQVIAWLAPDLDYVLVRLWQSEDQVEQFDIQLESYQPTATK